MSMISLVLSVASCYKMFKRAAIRYIDLAFVYLSLLMQVLARIIAIWVFFSGHPSFGVWLPLSILIHFSLVGIIKGLFAKELWVNGRFSPLANILNITSNQLVYVRIMPLVNGIDGADVHGDVEELDNKALWMFSSCRQQKKTQDHNEEHHSTFFAQFLFSVLVLAENILLCASPLYDGLSYDGGDELQHVYSGIPSVIALWLAGLVFMSLFYKFSHPWKGINGPCMPWGVSFPIYLCGTAKTVKWTRRCKKASFWHRNLDIVMSKFNAVKSSCLSTLGWNVKEQSNSKR